MKNYSLLFAVFLITFSCATFSAAQERAISPYEKQIAEQVSSLGDPSPAKRAGAAEALGFLRAYSAATALEARLGDKSPEVRREAAMSLAWCGSRPQVASLLAALDDAEWTVRQAAWVSLTNLTGMEWPFDALAAAEVRAAQAQRWRQWWAKAPADRAPQEVFDLVSRVDFSTQKSLSKGRPVTASSAYKGPPNVLTDGQIGPLYWQTKEVDFPQDCTIDLGEPTEIACVVVHQYGPGFCMTDYALSTSLDGENFKKVEREKGKTPTRLVITFKKRPVRFIKITSFASERSIYPTTFFEIEALAEAPAAEKPSGDIPSEWFAERGVRALGALAGKGATEAILEVIKPFSSLQGPYRQTNNGLGTSLSSERKVFVQVGLRSLGRLGNPIALPTLKDFLDHPQWARYAADALADFGGLEAAEALAAAYPAYAKSFKTNKPPRLPLDDYPGFESLDRMFETPYAILAALARMPILRTEGERAQAVRDSLVELTPLLAWNLPTDFDGAMLYEPEANQLATAYLLDLAGTRRAVCEAAFEALGQPRFTPSRHGKMDKTLLDLARKKPGDVPHAVGWITAFSREKKDAPRLIALLQHENGWAKINAAKTLIFMNEQSALEPIARLLAGSKTEADHGYFGGFRFDKPRIAGHSDYDDPAPRWRQAFTRALGLFDAVDQIPLLIKLLNDDRNALEIRYAAAQSLDEIDTPKAIAALKIAEESHVFHSIRIFAREALWKRGLLGDRKSASAVPHKTLQPVAAPRRAPAKPAALEAVVFIKGANLMPNAFQIDPWRQTYSTTDSGPTYRIGDNLYVLRPATPDGKVTPLTQFADGYVADCEVSPDGQRVVFARRGGTTDPWWHIFEIGVDGAGLRQITDGPYHDVQPAYFKDGRIVFSSSRIGTRDEYHGYAATGLTVMNADGSDIHCIGFNLGRDNEPAVLDDGRIVFSRLELFYSRLKTEITVHAVSPDGTRDVTLYGPERRDYWRNVTRLSGESGWGEAPPRHRVLRLTQPQPFSPGRILCASTGGLTLTGPGKRLETRIPHDERMAVTSPFPLGDGRILCSATAKPYKGNRPVMKPGDLGLYFLDAETGAMTLLYNDPVVADFEPRPIAPFREAIENASVLNESPLARNRSYTARFFCSTIRNSREPRVGLRGKLARVIEGLPAVARHHNHRSVTGEAWKNHTGTHARVLGTVPLGADGSFFVEAPADRLLQVQVLDSDRRVVGNQQIWMYGRPGETRSCVGCHEPTDSTPANRPTGFASTAKETPVPCLPTGGEFTYRAKLWQKGTLPDEGEERTRTVRAVNLLGRY